TQASRPALSVKLSALSSHMELRHQDHVMSVVLPRLKSIVMRAKKHGISVTIDAEEARRLDISLMLFEALRLDSDLAGYDGPGLAVQAYQLTAPHVIDWVIALGKESGQRIPVRLVKGAYW